MVIVSTFSSKSVSRRIVIERLVVVARRLVGLTESLMDGGRVMGCELPSAKKTLEHGDGAGRFSNDGEHTGKMWSFMSERVLKPGYTPMP